MKVSTFKKLVNRADVVAFNKHTGLLEQARIIRGQKSFFVDVDHGEPGELVSVTVNGFARFTNAIKALRAKDSALLTDSKIGVIPVETADYNAWDWNEWNLEPVLVLTPEQVQDAIAVAPVASGDSWHNQHGVFEADGCLLATNGHIALSADSRIENPEGAYLFLDPQVIKDYFPLFNGSVSVLNRGMTWAVCGTIDGHTVRIQYTQESQQSDFPKRILEVIQRENPVNGGRNYAAIRLTPETIEFLAPFAKIKGAKVKIDGYGYTARITVKTDNEELARLECEASAVPHYDDESWEISQTLSLAYLLTMNKAMGGGTELFFTGSHVASIQNCRYIGAIAGMRD